MDSRYSFFCTGSFIQGSFTASMIKKTDYEKTGYLHSPFRLFHLKDHEVKTYDCHYHDFYKILLFSPVMWIILLRGSPIALSPGILS